MSTIWGSENVVADHRDLQANTMAVDYSGQFAILAGRRHMGIVQLDQPSVVVHKTNRHSKWDVMTAEWSYLQTQCFALACNQRAELYTWGKGDVTQTASLKAHTRAISDLDWSLFDSHILATASIDTYIYLWDTRETRKPSISLSAVAGASQVKWNKLQSHLLATSHEGDIRLWDIRKSTSPVQYITAHLNKIHNIDWSPHEDNILATSSQDCTVKFWDVTVPRKVDESLQVPCPVWRAIYTPFGYGLVTVVVPPLRRGDNSLLLWNIKNCSTPVHTFFGHSDVVVEFGWRKPIEDSKDYQLVTFAKDYYLRTWVVDSQLQKACGHIFQDDDNMIDNLLDSQDTASQASVTSTKGTELETPSSPKEKNTRPKDTNGNIASVSIPLALPQNLQQEFSLVNLNIPNITIAEMDASKRSCTVNVVNGKYVVCLKLLFPATYPNNDPPSFQFCKGTNIGEDMKNKVMKVLKLVSNQQVRRNRSCLEPCLRQVVTTLDTLTTEEKNQPQMPDSPFHVDANKQSYNPPSYGFQDVSVPFPRTSGAKFCGADMLVVFTRPSHLHRINAPTDDTPRSLSALSAYIPHVVLPLKGRTTASSPGQYIYPPLPQSPVGDTSVSISSFYHQDRKVRKRRSLQDRRSSGSKQQLSNSGAVLIYSISKLMPINFNLAQNYVFGTKDTVATCSKNAAVAAKEQCRDLVQVWSLASLICNPTSMITKDPEKMLLWANHPFGRKMLQSLIFHYGNHYDVQTAAMLACAFHVRPPENKAKKAIDLGSGNISLISGKWWLKPGGSPYHTVVPSNNSLEGWSIVGAAALKRNRSNSWSDSVDDYSFFDDHGSRNGSNDFREEEKDSLEANTKLLDRNDCAQLDQYKMVYADVLYRWNLLEQRAQVLKTVSTPAEKHRGVDFLVECQHCKKDVTGPQCQTCKKHSFSCVICGIAVKGLSSFCMVCGHGGHTTHLQEWFSDMEVCPTGCGCNCLEINDIFGT